MKKSTNSSKGITLISLVITIIVLLILSGVALTMLTGENGILKMAKKAREKTEEAQKDEEQKLLMLEAISSDSETEYKGVKIPAGYTPTKRAGEDEVNKGLVITDANGNEWVWIAVSANLSSYTTDDQIETTLRTHCTKDKAGNDFIKIGTSSNSAVTTTKGYEDRWYDKLGTIYNGEDYSEIIYIEEDTNATAETRYNEAISYYGTLYTKTGENYAPINQEATYESGTTYYAKITDKLNDYKGCGLTYSEYNNKKSKMLQSIKKNGGFFVGRYEVGYVDSAIRKSGNENIVPTQLPVIKQNAYPYNCITCSQAEKLVESLSSGSSNKTTSLMFGLQWDLVLKFLNENGVDKEDIITNSTTWGNCQNAEFKVDRGEWAKYDVTNLNNSGIFYKFNDDTHYDNAYYNGGKGKIGVTNGDNGRVILTTGAADRNCKCNIYDFAGNLWEWTLERSSYSIESGTRRGGSFYHNGVSCPSSYRYKTRSNYYAINIGFRASLY